MTRRRACRAKRRLNRNCISAIFSGFLLLTGTPGLLFAEGTAQTGIGQGLLDFDASLDVNYAIDAASASLYLDILSPGEIINISLCGETDTDSISVTIFAPSNNIDAAFSQILNNANVACTDPFTGPLVNPIRLTASEIGAYRIELQNLSTSGNESKFRRYDISVTPEGKTLPDPRIASGRLWAYTYGFNANGFGSQHATDADYYVMVPGGVPNTNFVWQLDLNNFAGYSYNLVANSLGVNAPNSGYSTESSGNSVNYEHRQYLGYPAVANAPPSIEPTIINPRFIDSDGEDHSISPADTIGVQDSGQFEFETDVNGTYSIDIDLNRDGIFGNTGDRQLLGVASPGVNTVIWDGTDASGNPPPFDRYDAQITVRIGEYHFIANDVETSGGDEPGLTIRQVASDQTLVDGKVYWNDISLLPGAEGSSNTPNGASSATPEGHHTWGNFTGSGFGNERLIDTYVHGQSSSARATIDIIQSDTPVTNYDGVLSIDTTSLPGDSVAVTLIDLDENVDDLNIDSIDVSVVNEVSGELERIILLETTPDSGVFSGSIPTIAVSSATPSATSDNDGILVTSVGDVLTVTYIDRLDTNHTTQFPVATHTVSPDSDNTGIVTAQDSDDDNETNAVAFLPASAAETDSDSDGIPDRVEGSIDSDLDRTPDYLDPDSDNDGILDSLETAVDSDDDGLADFIDSDSDNDGILDSIETAVDSDSDGVPDFLDNDSDNDGIADSVETENDSDADGVADFLDQDSDNNGTLDNTETASASDTDNDGIPNAIEGSNDSDADGVSNDQDPDSDNDGILDSVEGLTDSDADGTSDFLDTDSDNDGISDRVETSSDSDSDGTPDFLDTDSDNDGIPDNVETATDSDGDGARDSIDPDSDNDSIPDSIETGIDSDGDGVADYLDNDSDNDGIIDHIETGIDNDLDGLPDFIDSDSDNDGILDSIETAADTDSDGVPDFLDTDSDNDSIPDSVETGIDTIILAPGGTTELTTTSLTSDVATDPATSTTAPMASVGSSSITSADSDGDGIPDSVEGDVDSDADGVLDSNDLDSDNDGLLDVDETARDSDGDGIADYQDLDSDNDGLTDAIEAGGPDADGDGTIDDFLDNDNDGFSDLATSLSLVITDTDSDGVPDFRDLDSDNDGLSDLAESMGFAQDADADGRIDGFLDADNDGLDDLTALSPMSAEDLDADGAPDHLDLDTDNDGIFDLVEGDGIDTDNDGRVDAFVDADGDGYVSILRDDNEQALIDALPDSNGNSVPDVDEAFGFTNSPIIRTGLEGSGCAIGGTSSKDPLLPMLLLLSIGFVARRRHRLSY